MSVAGEWVNRWYIHTIGEGMHIDKSYKQCWIEKNNEVAYWNQLRVKYSYNSMYFLGLHTYLKKPQGNLLI